MNVPVVLRGLFQTKVYWWYFPFLAAFFLFWGRRDSRIGGVVLNRSGLRFLGYELPLRQ